VKPVTDEFQVLRQALLSGGTLSGQATQPVSTPCYQRFLVALSDRSTSCMDLCALTRHVLRRESELSGVRQRLSMPDRSNRPTIEQWSLCGVEASSSPYGNLTLRARPWHPTWLPHADRVCPEADAYADRKRRHMDDTQGDPYLRSIGYARYICEGQQDAIRSVLLTPPGATLLIDLPTGAGKSACAHILCELAFAGCRSDGVTVVVVPTTALALDQQRAVQSLCYPTAYRGGEESGVRSQNQAIWNNVIKGNQKIVFTSPESLLGGLKQAVYGAAESGMLKALVIDEAHIIDQWGDEFRPAFQELSGMRRALLGLCPTEPFRTILMGATLTDHTLETLKTLFGEPGPFAFVSANQLRPEPAYWQSYCEAEELRMRRTVDAINHLPRPLILYTTTVKDAQSWLALLAQQGYARLDVMTGITPTPQREAIIDRWSRGMIDIMVATSAFGLGIDKRDVKAVVHACIPETLDRFYQEVGRSGRDGNASVSLLIYTARDMDNARSINQKTIIGLDKGLERWRKLFNRKVTLEDGRIMVPISVARKTQQNPLSDKNMEWNVKTLTLMSRAGLIALDDQKPKRDQVDENSEIAVQAPTCLDRRREEERWRVLEILNNAHTDRNVWEDQVERVRRVTSQASAHQLELLEQLLDASTCVSEVLAEAYTIRHPTNRFSHNPIAMSCGGCSYCRASGRALFASAPLSTGIPWGPTSLSISDKLRRDFACNSVLAIFYENTAKDSDQLQTKVKLLKWLLQQGIHCVTCSEELLTRFCDRVPEVRRKPVFFSVSYSGTRTPQVPTAVVYDTARPLENLETFLSGTYRSDGQHVPVVLVLPKNARDPQQPTHLLHTYLSCNRLTQDELMAREIL